MANAITPLADFVLAQAEVATNKTASGLYLPDGAKEKPQVAKILAVGTDVKNVKTGERIIYKSYSTTDIKHGGEEFVLVKEEDILATVK